MNTTEYLDAPIISSIQIGNFKLGDHVSVYEDVFKPSEYDLWKTTAAYPKFVQYNLLDSLILLINIFTGRLCQISVLNKYSGKYLDKIGIGSTIRELIVHRKDLFYDMEEVILGKDYELIIKIDNDQKTIYSIDEVLDNKITEIIIEDKNLF